MEVELSTANIVEIYLENLRTTLSDVCVLSTKIGAIVNALLRAYKSDNTIFIFGNGGSASTASHFCCDLSKGTITHTREEEKRLKVISLNDCIPLFSAWANDTEYSKVFVEQLKNLLRKGDVVIGISCSGHSRNVLEAIEYANEKDAYTIGFTGFGGGALKNKVDLLVSVPSDNTQRIEDVHLILCHIITIVLKERKR